MPYINAVEAAIKAKAPIVAIPVEGHAPVCVNRKRLAVWAKGVRITRTAIVGEGRWLVLEGLAKNNVRCLAKFVPMDRRTAIRELSIWSEKERVKLQKKIALGALSKEIRKEMRLAKFDDEGALTPVKVRTKDAVLSAYGVPVTIPELSEYSFVLHRKVNIHSGEMCESEWGVTETSSGVSAGSGKTAELALAAVRADMAKASPAKLATAREMIRAQTLVM